MTAYYLAVMSLLKLMKYRRNKIFLLANFLGYIRYHLGYIGKGKSKKLFFEIISRAFREKKRSEIEEILKKFWIMHQKSFLDFFMAEKLEKENYKKFFEYEGIESINDALLAGKGAILTTYHFGDGRILHIGLSLEGYPVSILSSKYTEYSKLGRDVRLRTSKKFHKVYYEGESMRWIYETLKKNELVFMSATAYAGKKGVFTDCLGSKIYASTALVRIALKTGAPLIPAVAIRGNRGDVKIFVKKPVPLEISGNRQNDIRINTEKLMDILQNFVTRFPDQHNWRVWSIRVTEVENIKTGIKS